MKYQVQMMTPDSYHAYMCGSNEYHVDEKTIVADTTEQALEIAKKMYPGYMINENYIKTLEELALEKAEREAYYNRLHAEEEAKRRAQAEKRKATLERKAAEAGLSVEDYRKLKKYKDILKSNLAELAQLTKRISELEEDNKGLEAKIARLEG